MSAVMATRVKAWAGSEHLLEIVGPCPGRKSFEHPEHGVPMALVERSGLEFVRVELRRNAAGIARHRLGNAQQTRSISLAARRFGDPQPLDRHPLPGKEANEPTVNCARVVAEVH